MAPAPTRMLFFGLVEARRILKNDDRALAIMLSDQIEAAPLGGGARREAMMHAAKVWHHNHYCRQSPLTLTMSLS